MDRRRVYLSGCGVVRAWSDLFTCCDWSDEMSETFTSHHHPHALCEECLRLIQQNAAMREALGLVADELMNIQPHIAQTPKQYQPFLDSHIDKASGIITEVLALIEKEKES
jgi:hypothetical protein